ncbi:unnamed protein product, partial [Musa textilis]
WTILFFSLFQIRCIAPARGPPVESFPPGSFVATSKSYAGAYLDHLHQGGRRGAKPQCEKRHHGHFLKLAIFDPVRRRPALADAESKVEPKKSRQTTGSSSGNQSKCKGHVKIVLVSHSNLFIIY